MLKFTLDTNILISATITKGNEYKLLQLAKEGKLILVLSPEIIAEFKGVITRPKFGFTKQQIDAVVKQILNMADISITTKKVDIIKDDSADNRILECAISGNADHIVSGDHHLLDLKKYKNIRIIRTWEALAIIKKGMRE